MVNPHNPKTDIVAIARQQLAESKENIEAAVKANSDASNLVFWTNGLWLGASMLPGPAVMWQPFIEATAAQFMPKLVIVQADAYSATTPINPDRYPSLQHAFEAGHPGVSECLTVFTARRDRLIVIQADYVREHREVTWTDERTFGHGDDTTDFEGPIAEALAAAFGSPPNPDAGVQALLRAGVEHFVHCPGVGVYQSDN